MNGLVVVAKKNGRFFTGGIKNDKFVRYREIKTLASLKHRDDYVTLPAYLKGLGLKTKPDVILASLKLDRLYIRQMPTMTVAARKLLSSPVMVEMPGTERAAEKLWWSAFHPTCIPCVKTCKQSHMMLSVYCPSRTTK